MIYVFNIDRYFDKHYPRAHIWIGVDISFPFPSTRKVSSTNSSTLWNSVNRGKKAKKKKKKKKNTRNGSIHGYNERDSSPGKIFFGKSETTARPSLARNPQDRPFSLLHSLFPIHQAFVTVIQIPIVIYVDINGNPSSCRCSSALVLLLHPSPPSKGHPPRSHPPSSSSRHYALLNQSCHRYCCLLAIVLPLPPSSHHSLLRLVLVFVFVPAARPALLGWLPNQYGDLYEFY